MGDAQAALTGATERLGAKAKLQVQGERAVLTLSGVPSEALQVVALAKCGLRPRGRSRRS